MIQPDTDIKIIIEDFQKNNTIGNNCPYYLKRYLIQDQKQKYMGLSIQITQKYEESGWHDIFPKLFYFFKNIGEQQDSIEENDVNYNLQLNDIIKDKIQRLFESIFQSETRDKFHFLHLNEQNIRLCDIFVFIIFYKTEIINNIYLVFEFLGTEN